MAIRHDAAVGANLCWVSVSIGIGALESFDWRILHTYVHIEVTICDIDAIYGLAEIDMGNAVGPDIVIVLEPELDTGNYALDKLGGGLEVCRALQEFQRRVGLGGFGVDILRRCPYSEFFQVHSSALGSVLIIRGGMAMGMGIGK